MKRGGTAAVPQGDASASAGRLINDLASAGLFVVPVGELERWVPEVESHGPAWVSAVLEQERHKQSGFQARSFMERVNASFA